MFRQLVTRAVTAAALVIVAMLVAIAHSAATDADRAGRFLGHASTDKPIYRIGERVYVRAVVLSADDHTPLPPGGAGNAMMQITGPKGETLATAYGQIEDSVAGFYWDVPEGASGGQYTAKVSFPWDGFPPAERKFEVRAYRAPRLKGEIVFLRDGFGPGDKVQASMHVERAEGGLPVGATVTPTAVVDGADVSAGAPTKIDSSGNCSVEFTLPTKITRGDGTLCLNVADGGVTEPIAKTIPIVLNTLDIAMYPEGGDLVAGLDSRVYLEARTPSQKPADLVGTIVDSQGTQVATVRTEHEGRARFSFTPKLGETYSLKLSQPSGIDKPFPLPMVKPAGVCVRADRDVTPAGEPIDVRVCSTDAGSYHVILSRRDVELSSLPVKLTAGESQPVRLTPPTSADGVLIVTVKNDKGVPLAERLVFRQPAHALHVSVAPDKKSYVPGDGATLTVTTTDDDGKPVGAVVGLTVTDDSVLQMIEKRERAPRLSPMVFLEDDVKDLADADVYLDPANPKAPLALDLLLGTQGWRRFATVDETKFLAEFGDDARRVLADLKPMPPMLQTAALGGAWNMPRGAAFANRLEQEHLGVLSDRLAAKQELPVAPLDKAAFQRDELGFGQRELDQKVAGLPVVLATVRVYAHDLRPNRQPNERVDFTETLYWAAGVKTDEKTGQAKVSFKLNDAISSFGVIADGFDSGGALGSATATIASLQPFYVESKLPLEVSTGDLIQLPIAAVNGTDSQIGPVHFTIASGKGIDAGRIEPFVLSASQRQRRLVDVKVGDTLGSSDFIVKADATRLNSSKSGAYADSVTRHLLVKPRGFPIEIGKGGILDANGSVLHVVQIPESTVAGSVTTSVALYPTPLGNLTEALQRLLQEPNGCFEQTSSTTYPLIMAQQYFLGHSGVDPQLIARSNELLGKGYKRLLGFECKNKGYEWFGEDPGHECLSAYGLLEFTDMSSVRSVDQKMLDDTRAWLLARRDGKGGFTHERRALHTWIADPGCANGYCTWALLECGQKDLEPEVNWLKQRAQTDPNSYVTALAANVLSLAGDFDGARDMMQKLASRQDKDGHVLGATTTVVGSGGDSLQIETTSLAVLAWLRDPSFAANVESGIRFLADSCNAGRYGSTQSTVLALRAIVAYDKSRAHPTAAGKVQLLVDGHPLGEPIPFDATTQGAIKLPDMSELMSPGKHNVELRMTDGSPLPYALAVSFNSVTPASSEQCKLRIATSLKDERIDEGAVSEVYVSVTNVTDEILPTPIAIVGLPGGLEVRHDQLKELVKAGRIAAYEVRGREVVLYWRDIQPNEKIQIPLSVLAAIPGTYTGPASRAYLYYTDEYKQWVDGMKVSIVPR